MSIKNNSARTYPRIRWGTVICLFLGSLVASIAVFGNGSGVSGEITGDAGYPSITGPCHLNFPMDHNDHPAYRTEWWYYTGNLVAESGARYGFQLTFFRSRMRPVSEERDWPSPPSAWRTSQLFLAHAALTDISGKHFHHCEMATRGALDMGGVKSDSSEVTVFVRNWFARLGATHRLFAESKDFSLDLSLLPVKAPVLHGDEGYSLKGSSPGQASCYYSLTRMATSGSLVVDGVPVKVTGTSWMDHEFSSAPLDESLVGWDWFGLQLSNGTELMVYFLREREGRISSVSSGTFVTASGSTVHLTRDQIEIQALDEWKSPRSGGKYPSRWRVHIPALRLTLTVIPNLADQELETPESTRVTYWEGSVNASGSLSGQPVNAVGYVELTGYAQPIDSRL